jgi:deoxyribodipyrimidine photo-lyase
LQCGNIPTLEELGYTPQEAGCPADPRGVMQFQGGETAGLARIQDYIFDKDCLKVTNLC